MFKGTPNSFKNTLDNFLSNIPDQPEVDTIKPGGRTLTGDCSNCIADWVRVLHLHDEYDESFDKGRTRISTDDEGRKTISINIVSEENIDSNIVPTLVEVRDQF